MANTGGRSYACCKILQNIASMQVHYSFFGPHHESPLTKIFLALTSSPEAPIAPPTMPAPPCMAPP